MKTNGDPVVIDEDRFPCDDAQLNIMPVFELVTQASDGQTNRIKIPWQGYVQKDENDDKVCELQIRGLSD